jgi:hypothetical protein
VLIRRVASALLRVALALAFLAVMAAVALGSAGIVAMWSHPPGIAARAELTWHGDSTLNPELDSAQLDLADISSDVDQLSTLARGALAALSAEDPGPFAKAISDGTTEAALIDTKSAALLARLAAMPGDRAVDAISYSADVLGRRVAIMAALDATGGLNRSWATLTAGALQASQLISLLDLHDSTVAAAAAQGRNADYSTALTTLTTAATRLAAAETIRNALANAVDVSTLDEWIARNQRYDQALTTLYTALRDSGGAVNDAVRAAYTEEAAARAQLPPDDRGLTVILSDIGRGGLNQAVIAIEQARGRLDLALEGLSSASN